MGGGRKGRGRLTERKAEEGVEVPFTCGAMISDMGGIWRCFLDKFCVGLRAEELTYLTCYS